MVMITKTRYVNSYKTKCPFCGFINVFYVGEQDVKTCKHYINWYPYQKDGGRKKDNVVGILAFKVVFTEEK